MVNNYTENQLIAELERFELLNGRVPTRRDMNNSAGYISQNVYYKFFGSFDVALTKAGMKLNRGYANKEFLINELQRFVLENGRNPIISDMGKNSGFPSIKNYFIYFNSWNESLVAAGLEINKVNDKLTGFETCNNCGKPKPNNQGWIVNNGKRYCTACSRNVGYRKGNLDPESTVGFAFVSQRVVAKVLDLALKDDCNCSIGFNSAYDLLDDGGFGYINVKGTVQFGKSGWIFNVKNKNIPDTYICLGYSIGKKNIEHVWIVDALDTAIHNKQSFTIASGEISLANHKTWEVDSEPYNTIYHSMSLENCSVLRSD